VDRRKKLIIVQKKKKREEKRRRQEGGKEENKRGLAPKFIYTKEDKSKRTADEIILRQSNDLFPI